MPDYSCELNTVPLKYYFNFDFAPDLLFYAYIPIAIIALFLGITVLVKERGTLRSLFLFLITAVFGISILNEIVLWVATPAYVVYFGWALVPLLRLLIIILTLNLAYTFTTKKSLPFKYNSILYLLSVPVFLFLPTKLNILYFDISNCEAVSGPLINYVYALGLLAVLVLIFSLIKLRKNIESKFLLIGSSLFLTTLTLFEFAGEYTGEYEINLIGPVGLLLFIFLLTYSIVRFKTFNIKLAAPVALMLGLVALIASELFFVETKINYILVSATLFFAIIGGYLLIRSVMKEIKQREQIETLAQDLARANVRLEELDKAKSEFVSIASHQLRSPLTSIRGYASMLAEGSFGKMTQKAQEAAARIEESAKLMAMSVEDYLNVSRIESGNMKYNLTDFNLRDMTDTICEDLRSDAMKHNLILLFRTNLNSRGIVNADVGKTNQIVHNLINNSIKYTPKGTINVFMRDDLKKKKIYVEITDTGIGMSQETINKLFNKFTRADNANSVNVSGTGLGLFVALKMAEQMGGNISAQSEGDTKGSTFTFELPLQM